MEPIVHILLPVHNRKDITVRFVRALKKQSFQNFKLVLIDDGSTDKTADVVIKMIPSTTVIRGSGDWWWAGSLQHGYLWLKKQNLSSDDCVLIINDDVIIENDFIASGVSVLNRSGKALIGATAYDIHTGLLVDNGVNYDFKNNILNKPKDDNEVNCLSTRGLFLKAKDFVALRGFHPVLLPHYTSDYEFTIRAHRKGYRLICSEKVKLWFDPTTTGIYTISSQKWNKFIKLYFSKRYVNNPLYKINYYLLTFPFPYNLKHAFIELLYMFHALYAVFKYNLNYR